MDIKDEVFYSMALASCSGVGYTIGKRLLDTIGSASEIITNRKSLKDAIPDLSDRIINTLGDTSFYREIEREMEYAEKNNIECIPYLGDRYPKRLRNCVDAPLYLFFKGRVNLNALRVVNMVGTRQATDYGKEFCNSFLKDLSQIYPDVLVVSGLAYGIDVAAHRAALSENLPTVGVLAHGLRQIYPSLHKDIALEMQNNGGLLTEYFSNIYPDRHHFIARNRIVAGMSDATIVVESKEKGGALITADLANSYNRECFALPGRVGDMYSKGCINLIHANKAQLLTSAEEFCNDMGWVGGRKSSMDRQLNLFPDLDEKEQKVADLLAERGDMHIDNISVESGIPIYKINSLLFKLEMKGVIKPLVGGVYHLL